MADITNFDNFAARAWKQEVDAEIQEIETLLEKVRELTSTVPGSDDTIMKAIVAIGENERKIWSAVTKAFSEVSEKTHEIICSYEKWGDEALERINAIIAKRS